MTGADRRPRIAFLGTGAQGASIGADFALAGLDVTFIEQWPEHVKAIRRDGITVNLPWSPISARNSILTVEDSYEEYALLKSDGLIV